MLLFNVKLLFFSNVVLLYGLHIDETGSTNIYFVGVESFSRLRVKVLSNIKKGLRYRQFVLPLEGTVVKNYKPGSHYVRLSQKCFHVENRVDHSLTIIKCTSTCVLI